MLQWQETYTRKHMDRDPSQHEAIPMTFIERPPDPQLQMSIVIPVFREYENGNIFRVIAALTKQRADPHSFETTLVVNNTIEARKKSQPGYEENLRTLEVVRYLQGEREDPPEDITALQKNILDEAKRHGIRLHAIDLTDGLPEVHMGRVRNIGLQHTLQRLAAVGQESRGVVAQLDADALPRTTFVGNVQKFFLANPTTDTLFNRVEFTPEGHERLYATVGQERWTYAMSLWNDILRQPARSHPQAGGPQIIATVDAWKKVHGVPEVPTREDSAAAERLLNNTRYAIGTTIAHDLTDRAREESFDGHNRLQGIATKTPDANRCILETHPRLLFLKKALACADYTSRVMEKYAQGKDDGKEIATIFQQFHVPFHKETYDNVLKTKKSYDLRTNHLQEYILTLPADIATDRQRSFNLAPSAYARELLDVLKEQFSNQPHIITLLQRNIVRIIRREGKRHEAMRQCVERAVRLVYRYKKIPPDIFREDPIITTTLASAPWMLGKLQQLRKDRKTPENALASLKLEYPELLQPFEETQFLRPAAILHGILLFFREARATGNAQYAVLAHVREFLDSINDY